MTKETIHIDKEEIEDAIKKTSDEIFQAYNTLKTGKLDEATTAQLENIREEVVQTCTEGEIINLLYFAKNKKNAPFYEHMMGSGKAVVNEINSKILSSKLENL